MKSDLSEFHDTPEVGRLLRQVDGLQIAAAITQPYDISEDAVSRLRLAAVAAFADAFDTLGVDAFLRKAAAGDFPDEVSEEHFHKVFFRWVAYLEAASSSSSSITIDDVLLLAAAGLLARRSTEVRTILRRASLRGVVDALSQQDNESWPRRIRNDITAALVLLIRQESRNDVEQAGEVIRRLSRAQRELESNWLKDRDPVAQRDAAHVLGLYHLAHACVRSAEFLLGGSVEVDGRRVSDFGPELRRLLVKAEEFLSFVADPELDLWLNAVAAVLWRVRTESLWASARGISQRLDEFLDSLASRDTHPVLSLLPSQQDALRKSLLDRAKIAVVLQMPTSAGKTLLAEFAILQAFESYRGATRVVYLCPTRALVTQVRRTLAEDLGPLGIAVLAAGSAFEEDPYELCLLEGATGVVVATPEKLDLLLRAHPSWLDLLRLVVVDEAHLLRESERGVRLELLLANLRREQPEARLLLLTPFVKNAPDIARWLGGDKGLPIEVHWRPSRILLGLAAVKGAGRNRALRIEWKEPYGGREPEPLQIHSTVPSAEVNTSSGMVAYLAEVFQNAGTVLAMFSSSRVEAEETAQRLAKTRTVRASSNPNMRIAIEVARSEQGSSSRLAFCLERGVAFHHSAISPLLRYLIEDQVRSGDISFISATTTLAQGMNFPVAVVLVQSVHKPYGKGPLSAAEFWNIAGRAGRVGLSERGFVVFAGSSHREEWTRYSNDLSDAIFSALLEVLRAVDGSSVLREAYRIHESLRPFFQYLAHAVASKGHERAAATLEELLQGSLADQALDGTSAKKLRLLARRYLSEISNKGQGFIKAADTTGLGSFSFDTLYAKIKSDPVLGKGPGEILRAGATGMHHLVDALRWLPELGLALGLGPGTINVSEVAAVVQGWIAGKSVPELARHFKGKDETDRIRKATAYLHGTVSQTISWGAHAYLRGWAMASPSAAQGVEPSEGMLPAYIQYGVKTPEAALASLLGVPRPLAEGCSAVYRAAKGTLRPEDSSQFKTYLESADRSVWADIVRHSALSGRVDPNDIRACWRQMQGLTA